VKWLDNSSWSTWLEKLGNFICLESGNPGNNAQWVILTASVAMMQVSSYLCVSGWIHTCSSTVPFHDVARPRRSTVPNVSVGISQEVPWLFWQSVWLDSHTLQCWGRSHGNFHRSGLSAWPGQDWAQSRCLWMCMPDEEQPCQYGPDRGYYYRKYFVIPLVTLSYITWLTTLLLMNSSYWLAKMCYIHFILKC